MYSLYMYCKVKGLVIFILDSFLLNLFNFIKDIFICVYVLYMFKIYLMLIVCGKKKLFEI